LVQSGKPENTGWAGPEFQWTVDWENLKRRNQSYVHIKEERF
jgi:hypothetical protein